MIINTCITNIVVVLSFVSLSLSLSLSLTHSLSHTHSLSLSTAYITPNDVLRGITSGLAEALGIRNADGLRYIVLRYAEGGENWLHQDQSEHPFQALLLLSDPGEDYTGGELFVQRKEDLTAEPAVAEFEGAGDLVVFAANTIEASRRTSPFAPPPKDAARSYLHAMRTVRRGKRAECERWAIGLLQPRAPAAPANGGKRKQAAAAADGGKQGMEKAKKKKKKEKKKKSGSM